MRSHKVLGLVIQSNLKWNEHITSVVSKASKRLCILRVLRRSGVPVEDLINIYFAIIRSVLEYCCVVWQHAVTLLPCRRIRTSPKTSTKNHLTRPLLQRSLSQFGMPIRLDERREQLCLKTMGKIVKGGPVTFH